MLFLKAAAAQRRFRRKFGYATIVFTFFWLGLQGVGASLRAGGVEGASGVTCLNNFIGPIDKLRVVTKPVCMSLFANQPVKHGSKEQAQSLHHARHLL